MYTIAVIPVGLALHPDVTVNISSYIHNWSLQLVITLQSVRVTTDLASHTTYVECVNFIQEWGDLQFSFFQNFADDSQLYLR